MTKLLLSILVSTFLGSSINLVDGASVIEEDGRCNGSVTGTIVYGDGEVVKFVGKTEWKRSSIICRCNSFLFW